MDFIVISFFSFFKLFSKNTTKEITNDNFQGDLTIKKISLKRQTYKRKLT